MMASDVPIEDPSSISSKETELQIQSMQSIFNAHTDSTYLTLLDDFQLDLDLECEDDGIVFIPRDHTFSFWNSDISRPIPLNLPVTNSHTDDLKGEIQQKTIFPICELVNLDTIDCQNEKSKDLATCEGGDLVEKSAEICHENIIQADMTPIILAGCKSESDSASISSPKSIFQDAVICPLCKILFSSMKSFQLHFSDQHCEIKTEPEYHPSCSLGVEKNNVKHKNCTPRIKIKKKDEGPFPCPTCPYIGKTNYLLQLHNKNRHNEEREIFRCDVCPFTCVQERSFRIHKMTHECKEGKFACDQCGKLFFTMGVLKRHARTHLTSWPYICDHVNCTKAFTMKSRLTDHIRAVHKRKPITKKNVFQKEKGLQESGKINSRVLSANDTFKTLLEEPSLPVNSQSFIVSSENYEKDITNVYDIILTKDTTISDIPGTKSPNLPRTQQTSDHSSNACNDYMRTTKGNTQSKFLNLNNVRKEKMKKFQCLWKDCGKYFRDNYNLKQHICTHTGEMGNACPYCRYRCIQKSSLIKHMRTHKNLEI